MFYSLQDKLTTIISSQLNTNDILSTNTQPQNNFTHFRANFLYQEFFYMWFDEVFLLEY